MTSRLGALLAGIFLVALLSATIAQFSRRIERLQNQFEESLRRQARAPREVPPPARPEPKTPPRLGLPERSGSPAGPGTPGPERGRLDYEALTHYVLAPSVQVNGPGGVGGGTVLYTGSEGTFVVTAYHVIHKTSETEEPPTDGEGVLEVRFYGEGGEVEESCEAHLAGSDEKKDLALLALRTENFTPIPARLASRPMLRSIRVFTPIYAMGCPLGHDPLPTPGEVATLHKEVGGEKFWMMNAPTIFGNSGGGIFHRETRELIGVSVMICTYDGVVSTPVPHLGIFVSLERVYDWLDSLHFRFVYDPGTSPDLDRHAREGLPAAPAPIGGHKASSFQDPPARDP